MADNRRLWVVEVWDEVYERWEPTVGAGLLKEDALMRMHDEWKENNPDDRFRLRCYTPRKED